MKTIRVHEFGGPDILKLEELPDPTPAAGQVVVKINAIGVNPVETYIRAGKYGPRPFPYTPGTDAAGVIATVGAGVKAFRAGDSRLPARQRERHLCRHGAVQRIAGASSSRQNHVRTGGGTRRSLCNRIPRPLPSRKAHRRGNTAGSRREWWSRNGGSATRVGIRTDRHRHRRHRQRSSTRARSGLRNTCLTIMTRITCKS